MIRFPLFELRSLVQARGISEIHYKLFCNITFVGTKKVHMILRSFVMLIQMRDIRELV